MFLLAASAKRCMTEITLEFRSTNKTCDLKSLLMCYSHYHLLNIVEFDAFANSTSPDRHWIEVEMSKANFLSMI